MGFEKFSCGAECIEAVRKIAEILPKRESVPYIIISGTPIESLWPAKDVLLGVDGTVGVKSHTDTYDTVAFGPDRQTPYGPLPACIIAVRKDIANYINYNDEHKPLVVTGNKENKDWYMQPSCSYCNAGYCERGVTDPCPSNTRMCPFIGHYKDCSDYTPNKPVSSIKIKQPLMGPDWKPAPGFERPW